MQSPPINPTFAPGKLRPKRRFGERKLLAWLLIGPLNPLSWILIFVIEDWLTPFGVVGFFTIWPCSLGAAILMLRLRETETTHFKLQEFTSGWTVLTIPLYAFVVGVWFFLVWLPYEDADQGFDFAQQLGYLGGYTLIGLPFAWLIGGIPAMCAGIWAYLTARTVLFEPTSRPAARP